jgi:hypothetical protein
VGFCIVGVLVKTQILVVFTSPKLVTSASSLPSSGYQIGWLESGGFDRAVAIQASLGAIFV